jgi:hypothetical protein
MNLEETEARNDCAGEDQQQFNGPTSSAERSLSPETAVRRVGVWCEMAASLRGRDPGSTGSSTVGRRYQAKE